MISSFMLFNIEKKKDIEKCKAYSNLVNLIIMYYVCFSYEKKTKRLIKCS